METWIKVIVLSIGGALGVNARYWLGIWMARWTSPEFPWATITINVSGSFLIGFLAVVLTTYLPHPHLRLFVVTGFLGGYTTFSSFEFETAILLERRQNWLAAGNLVGSVVAGFVAVALGMFLANGLVSSISPSEVAIESPVEQTASADDVFLE